MTESISRARPIILLVPLLLILLLKEATAQNELAWEVALVGSGFLALLFGGLLFVLLLPFPGQKTLLMRKVLFLLLALFPLLLLPPLWAAPGILLAGTIALLHFLPGWQEEREEDERVEPIFFLLVAVKVAIVVVLLAGHSA